MPRSRTLSGYYQHVAVKLLIQITVTSIFISKIVTECDAHRQSHCPSTLRNVIKTWTTPCAPGHDYCAPGGNRSMPGLCPGKLVFNPHTLRCDDFEKCQTGLVDEDNVQNEKGEVDPEEKEAEGDCLKKACGLYPDKKDCAKYYICSGGYKFPKKCPLKTIFDYKIKDCKEDGECIIEKLPPMKFIDPTDVQDLAGRFESRARIDCPFHLDTPLPTEGDSKDSKENKKDSGDSTEPKPSKGTKRPKTEGTKAPEEASRRKKRSKDSEDPDATKKPKPAGSKRPKDSTDSKDSPDSKKDSKGSNPDRPGTVLDSEKVTDYGEWYPWAHCPVDTYFTGLSIWKRSTEADNDMTDHAGVVSLGFKCENPTQLKKKVEGKSDLEVGQCAKGAPDTGWRDFLECEHGAVVGFQLSQQPDQGKGKDNVATDNVRIICSCGEERIKYKPYHKTNIPAYLKVGGHRGKWTAAKICEAKMALCGMQSQMQSWKKEKEVDLSVIDMTGLNQVKMKCCPVTDPAEGAAIQVFRFVETCDNSQSNTSRLCPFTAKVGTGYLDDGASNEEAIAFYESVGFKFKDGIEKLKKTLQSGEQVCEGQAEGKEGAKEANSSKTNCQSFTWSEKDQKKIFQPPTIESGQILVKPGVKVGLYQVVITTKTQIYSVYTNYFVRQRQLEGAKFADKCPGRIKFSHTMNTCKSGDECGTNATTVEEDDQSSVIKPTNVQNRTVDKEKKWPEYHGFPASTGKKHGEAGGPLGEGIELDLPEGEATGTAGTWRKCPEGSYITAMTIAQKKVESGTNAIQELGFRCENFAIDKDKEKVEKVIGESDGFAPEFVKCDRGAAVGLQLSQVKDNGPPVTNDVRLICSAGKQKLKSHPKSEANLTNGIWSVPVHCDEMQALCGFLPHKAESGSGFSHLKLLCCNVPLPDKCTPSQSFQLLQTCSNKKTAYRRACPYKAVLGATFRIVNPAAELAASFYLSIGFKKEEIFQAIGKAVKSAEKVVCSSEESKDPNPKKCDPDKDLDSACWKDSASKDLYQPMKDDQGETSIKKETDADLFQTVIHCGIVKLFTNQIIKVRQGKDGPLPDEYGIF